MITVTAPKSWMGGKVNQLGYVAPRQQMEELQEMGFCI